MGQYVIKSNGTGINILLSPLFSQLSFFIFSSYLYLFDFIILNQEEKKDISMGKNFKNKPIHQYRAGTHACGNFLLFYI